MPIIEHLICDTAAAAERATRGVVARSAGVSTACASEILNFCNGWGRVPSEGLRRPVLMSFPLESTLAALPGQLHTIIRSTIGMDPVFHAVIMTDNDYGAFARNPFAVVNENVFIDDYLPGLILEQMRVEISSFAPLVAPLPSSADVGFVDEAARQVLARKSLLLPLGSPDVRSDRVLALVIASLPLIVKRRLRFASWATSDVNNFTLAATFTNGAGFEVWQRLLLTRVSGKLPAATEQYLGDIKQRLGAGDLMGLDSVSLQNNVELPVHARGRSIKKAGNRSATIVKRRASAPIVAARTAPIASVTGRGGRHGHSQRDDRQGGPTLIRTHRVVGRRRGNRLGKTVVILLAVAMFSIGGAALLGHNEVIMELARGFFEREEGPPTPGMSALGIVDVASLYEYLLFYEQGRAEEETEALTVLIDEAVIPLAQHSKTFVARVGGGIDRVLPLVEERARLSDLEGTGKLLERELKRLILAYASLAGGWRWYDLRHLTGVELSARVDSLAQAQPQLVELARQALDAADPVKPVQSARRQLQGLNDLFVLLDQDQISADWSARVDRAAKAAPSRSSQGTDRVCTAARNLAQLKRAETAADWDELVFAHHFAGSRGFPPALRQATTAVRRDAGAFAAGTVPSLLAATAELYTAIDSIYVASRRDDLAGILRTLDAIDSGRAMHFDAARYRDLVARSRVSLLETLVARGLEVDTLPDALFPDRDRPETLAFMAARGSGLDANGWQAHALSCQRSFFARWALHEAHRAGLRTAPDATIFDQLYASVMHQSEILKRRASAGQDWTAQYVGIVAGLAELRDDWSPEVFAGDQRRREQLNTLQGLSSRLALQRPAELTGVTVRLPQEAIIAPVRVQVEFRAADGSWQFLSEEFVINAAAPVGSGWVGHQPLDWQVPVQAQQAFVLRVVDASATAAAAPLLIVDYPALLDGVGPAALLRPRRGTGGSVTFRINPAFWHQLELAPPN